MIDVFKQLGISSHVRDVFSPYMIFDAVEELRFNYGYQQELFGVNRHLVPVTDACWFAGQWNPSRISHVFMAESAMEMIAFFERKTHMYKNTDQLLFIATGLSPSKKLLAEIGELFKARKFTIVHDNDLLGRVWSVKVAGWLFGKQFKIKYLPGYKIKVYYLDCYYCLPENEFNLNQVQLKLGMRLKVKTIYPRVGRTFIQQLQYEHLL